MIMSLLFAEEACDQIYVSDFGKTQRDELGQSMNKANWILSIPEEG